MRQEQNLLSKFSKSEQIQIVRESNLDYQFLTEYKQQKEKIKEECISQLGDCPYKSANFITKSKHKKEIQDWKERFNELQKDKLNKINEYYLSNKRIYGVRPIDFFYQGCGEYDEETNAFICPLDGTNIEHKLKWCQSCVAVQSCDKLIDALDPEDIYHLRAMGYDQIKAEEFKS